MKKEGKVYKGEAKPKADVAIILSDDTFLQLSQGKVRTFLALLSNNTADIEFAQLDGQKAFMTGKLKTKGNMMLATKLDGVLKVCSKLIMTYLV